MSVLSGRELRTNAWISVPSRDSNQRPGNLKRLSFLAERRNDDPTIGVAIGMPLSGARLETNREDAVAERPSRHAIVVDGDPVRGLGSRWRGGPGGRQQRERVKRHNDRGPACHTILRRGLGQRRPVSANMWVEVERGHWRRTALAIASNPNHPVVLAGPGRFVHPGGIDALDCRDAGRVNARRLCAADVVRPRRRERPRHRPRVGARRGPPRRHRRRPDRGHLRDAAHGQATSSTRRITSSRRASSTCTSTGSRKSRTA